MHTKNKKIEGFYLHMDAHSRIDEKVKERKVLLHSRKTKTISIRGT